MSLFCPQTVSFWALKKAPGMADTDPPKRRFIGDQLFPLNSHDARTVVPLPLADSTHRWPLRNSGACDPPPHASAGAALGPRSACLCRQPLPPAVPSLAPPFARVAAKTRASKRTLGTHRSLLTMLMVRPCLGIV